MAVIVKVVQDKRENSNHMWFGRGVHPITVDTKYCAERIAENTTATLADTRAVLTSFIKVMNDALSNSMKVKIDDLGIFWVSPRTKGALKREDFDQDCIKGVHVRFQPATTKKDGHITSKSLGWDVKGTLVDLTEKTKNP